MTTETPHEKMLFALRVNEDGSTTVTTSAEWDAYHTTRGRGRGERGHGGHRRWRWHPHHDAHASRHDHAPHHTQTLREALNSLETLYDDLYADAQA